MIIIIAFTIVVGVAVITMRSKTYAVGYEIANLKEKEKILRQQQIELQANLAEMQRKARDNILAQTNTDGTAKYVLPDPSQVINE